jgi:DnaJ-class molecular chaperone
MASLAPHEILDLDPDATPAEIRSAYRRLALQVHPDTNRGDPFAAARFREVRAAYEAMLRDHERSPAAAIGPVRVACVLVGPHLVGTLPIRGSGARRHRWIPLTLWAMRGCGACEGDGCTRTPRMFPLPDRREDCTHCEGTGVVGVERKLAIRLPALRAGMAIRLRGKGLGPGGHAFVHLR